MLFLKIVNKYENHLTAYKEECDMKKVSLRSLMLIRLYKE